MQRFHVIKIPIELTDPNNSPEECCPSDTHKVVPDSFADWLAQPAQTITAGPELEQGIFIGVMTECRIQIAAGHPPGPAPLP